MAIGHQSFYQTALTSGITSGDLVIPLDTVPTPSEGFLVIESTVEAKREIIYYTSKDATTVTCPSGAGNGRGYDGTTAVSHLQGATVIMAPVGVMFEKLGDIEVNSITIGGTASATGWSPLGATPDTVTALGNNSFSMVYNANDLTDTLTNGMRVRATRTVAAPNTAFSLDGTNDYYVKTTPNKLTFTDDFVCSAWVYLTSYSASDMAVVSRWNGTSGFVLRVNTNGTILMAGYNGGASNNSYVASYQSVPLNRWVHIAAQLDMSAFTATTTTSYIMMDGVDIPASVTRGGTNPTALVQAGNLEIGSTNGGTQPFPGYIDQVAVYSAKVTQATILASINRALTGSETSLASAYSNGSVNDLNTTTPNNLTATNGATTVANSPFGNRGVSTTLEYGIVMANTFSTNTTVTVQVPEGCQLPTTGGISSVDYSTQSVPYGFVRDKSRWSILMLLLSTRATSGTTVSTYYNPGGVKITAPIGAWRMDATGAVSVTPSANYPNGYISVSTSNSATTIPEMGARFFIQNATTSNACLFTMSRSCLISVSTATPYYWLVRHENAFTLLELHAESGTASSIKLENNYL